MLEDKVTQAERRLADVCCSCGKDKDLGPYEFHSLERSSIIKWAVRLAQNKHHKCFPCWMHEDYPRLSELDGLPADHPYRHGL